MGAHVPRQSTRGTIDPVRERPAVGDRSEPAIRAQERGDVVVLEPLGQLDREGVERLREAADALGDRAILIDLNSCVLTDPRGLAALADETGARSESCFVSRRATCRLLLDRAGITSHFAVFHQLEDALQARTFAHDGYGPGWGRGS